MHMYLLDMLTCPSCHNELDWTITQKTNERIEEGEARCKSCSRTYSVHDGIGIFLTDDPHRNDLWEQADSGLMRYLKSSPEQHEKLMDTALDTLSPTDQFLRGMILEELGRFAEAKEAHNLAMPGLYTGEYLNCFQKQIDYVVNELSSGNGPVVDLGSGRGYLVEQLVAKLNRPIVATDFSPRVLHQDKRRFEFEGVYEQVSLLTFDARLTPFRDHSVETLTTNLGLPNIEDPGALLKELQRIVSGSFFAISHFFPPDDQKNGEEIRKLKLEAFLYRQTALENFARANWQAEIRNSCKSRTLPTPASGIIEGLRNDALPVDETELEWGVLVAN